MHPSHGQETYQEQRVGQEGVDKQRPPSPATRPLAAINDLGDADGHDDAHKLVARVRHQVQQLRLVGDAQQIAAQLQPQDLDNHRHQRRRRNVPKQFRLELALQPGDEGLQEDVRHQRHDGDVHVRTVDVVARRQVPSLLPRWPRGLPPSPWLVPPGEEDEEQLVYYVRVGHDEVVLEGRDIDEAVYLAVGTSGQHEAS